MEFKCRDKCGECCGIIPLDKEIIERNKDKIQGEVVEVIDGGTYQYYLTKDLGCIFLDRETKKCNIYNDRPDVCKMYGVTMDPRLQCPYIKPNGNPRSEAGRKRIERQTNKIIKEALK